MNATKKLLSLSVLLLCAMCAKARTYIYLNITNKYPQDVEIYYYVKGGIGTKFFKVKGEIKGKKCEVPDLEVIYPLPKGYSYKLPLILENSMGAIFKVEFVAKGTHLPGSYTVGKWLGQKWGGRREINIDNLIKDAKKIKERISLIKIELTKKEKKRYKIIAVE